MDVLAKAEFKLEKLVTFTELCDVHISENLSNLFIIHLNETKKIEFMKSFDIQSASNGYCLPDITAANAFAPFILNKIFGLMKKQMPGILIKYLIEECYLLIESNRNSYEPLMNYPQFQSSLLVASKRKKRKLARQVTYSEISTKLTIGYEENHEFQFKKTKCSSPDLWINRSTDFTYSPFKISKKHRIEIKNLRWTPDSKCIPSDGEEIIIDPYLYNTKQRTKWPTRHPLSMSNSKELFRYIIHSDLGKKNTHMLDEWERASEHWTHLAHMLQLFVSNETKICLNNGYHRIFKCHFKKHERLRTTTDTIHPVEKSIVTGFICDILRKTLPIELFGNKGSLKKFFSSVSKLINSFKNESFALQSFVLHIPQEAAWTKQIEIFFRQTIILKLMKFFINDFILNMIGNLFYITELTTSGNKLFFYIKADVESATFKIMQNMIAHGKLKKIDVNRHCLQESQLCGSDFDGSKCYCQNYVSKVRLLPKTMDFATVRFITLKPAKFVVNEINELRLFLKCINKINGTGVQPYPSDSHLLYAWDKIVKLKNRRYERLFYVKADVLDAFGCIKYKKLFPILNNIVSGLDGRRLQLMTIREWAVRHGKIMLLFRKSFSRQLYPNRILHSRSFDKTSQHVEMLMNDVKKMISLQYIRVGGETYQMTMGVCQGGAGPLSTLLCDIYYSRLDQEIFNRYRSDDFSGAFVRAVDDYIFITTERRSAESFYKLVLDGIEGYNVVFNTNKLRTNLFAETPLFTYVGLVFNVDSLLVEPDYSKHKIGAVIERIKLKHLYLCKDEFVTNKLTNFSGLKLVDIVFKNENNTVKHLRRVTYKACLVQVYKSLDLALFFKLKSLNIIVILFKVCMHLARSIRNICQLSSKEIEFMFWKAALITFQRKHGNFPNLCNLIQLRIMNCSKYFRRNHSCFIEKFIENDVSDILSLHETT